MRKLRDLMPMSGLDLAIADVSMLQASDYGHTENGETMDDIAQYLRNAGLSILAKSSSEKELHICTIFQNLPKWGQ